MNSIQYHEVQPQNQQDSYNQFNTISFEILSDGRKLNPNSIRLDFDLEVFKTGATRAGATDKIYANKNILAHSFFESFQTTIQSRGLIENLQEYPRWANIHATATHNVNDFQTCGFQAEGRQLLNEAAAAALQRQSCHSSDAAAHYVNPAFTIKPLIGFNRMMGDGYSFSKNGFIRIDMNVARNLTAIYGSDVAADASFALKNVRLRYTTRPDDGSQGKILMNSYVQVKATSTSQNYNVDSRVPSKAVNGVVISFLETAHESSTRDDTYRLEKYPSLDEINYRFNDAQNRFVTYSVTHLGDQVKKGIQALSDGGVAMANRLNIAANEAFIVGLPFQEYVDLSTQKFSVNLKSTSTNLNTSPRNVYLFFLTLVSI